METNIDKIKRTQDKGFSAGTIIQGKPLKYQPEPPHLKADSIRAKSKKPSGRE
jgi:hypothetical protein